MRLIPFTLLAYVSLVLAPGCSDTEPRVIELSSEPLIEADRRKVNAIIDSRHGVPEGWPADVPIHPDATGRMGWIEEGESTLLGTVFDASVEDVWAFYQKAMTTEEWGHKSKEHTSFLGEPTVLHEYRKHDRRLSVILTDEGEAVGIQLLVYPANAASAPSPQAQ